MGAGVDRFEHPPVVVGRAEAARVFARHRLAPLRGVVDSVLVDVARYARQVVTIADADGLILWTGGHTETLQAAEAIHLQPGVSWSENTAGTNALGTALVLNHPLQIFAAEHFKQSMHGWSSAAAPIRDPDGGGLVGALMLSGPFKAAHLHGFSLVVAVGRIIEAHLEHELAQRDERLKVSYLEHLLRGCADASAVVNSRGRVLLSSPQGWLGGRLRLSADDGVPLAPPKEDVTFEPFGDGSGFLVLRRSAIGRGSSRPSIRLEALGRERACVTLNGWMTELSRRHSEILVILAAHPAGLSEQELASALYGNPIKGVTIRAEISRLHKLLGPIIKTRPYRIAAEVHADFLEAGDDRSGELLPGSTAPGVLAAAQRLAVG